MKGGLAAYGNTNGDIQDRLMGASIDGVVGRYGAKAGQAINQNFNTGALGQTARGLSEMRIVEELKSLMEDLKKKLNNY